MTSREHMFKGLYKFMGGSPSWWVTTFPSLVVVGIVVARMFLVCHVIKQGHVIKSQVL